MIKNLKNLLAKSEILLYNKLIIPKSLLNCKEKIQLKILGIDPGFAIVGYGVIDYVGNKFTVRDYGAVTTNAGENIFHRLKQVYDEVSEIIARTKPDCMAIEELFFNTNTKTAITVAEARGILIIAALNAGIPVFEYTPLQVKQAVTGYGRADKNQVQQMIKILLNLEKIPKPDDVADALAIAICCAHSVRR